METPEQEFNPDRVLRMVRNDKVLNKIWQRVHPQDNRNNAALRSIYNALIVGDRKNMDTYTQTK